MRREKGIGSKVSGVGTGTIQPSASHSKVAAMETNLSPNEKGRPARRQFTPQQVAEYLQAQPASGMTVTAFCQQHGLHPSVFYGWKRRQRPAAVRTPSFHEVTLPALMTSPWVAEITLPTGAVLRLSAQANRTHLGPWLTELLQS